MRSRDVDTERCSQTAVGAPIGSPGYGLVDVLFHAPRSFELLVQRLRTTHRHLEAGTFENAHDEAANWTRKALRRPALDGRLADHDWSGTPVDVVVRPDDPAIGIHHHLYIQREGPGRDSGLTVDQLHTTLVRYVWGGYLRRLRTLTMDLGVVWGRPLPGASYEIVDPPLAEEVGEGLAVTACECPRYGGDVIVLPDASMRQREDSEQSTVLIEAARTGVSYWSPPDDR